MMLRLLTVIVSVPNAVPETVKLWFGSKIASHSARANQLSAKAHSRPRPTVAPKLLLLLRVKEAGTLLTVSAVGTYPSTTAFAIEQNAPTFISVANLACRHRYPSIVEGNGGGVGGPRCNGRVGYVDGVLGIRKPNRT